jgi:hypothetical protein
MDNQPLVRASTGPSCLEESVPACGEAAFRLFVKHERARINRNGGEFGLVLWELGVRASATAYERMVLRKIRQSMRSVDILGWAEGGVLGVLLPATGFDGATTFAGHAADAIAREGPLPAFSVLAYPKRWDERPWMD